MKIISLPGKKLLIATCLVALAASPALAGGYEDFNRGVTAFDSGDWAGAIAGFDAALAGKDLAIGLRPVALLDRGAAHEKRKEYPQAIADLSAAIALRPDYFSALLSRAGLYATMGNPSAASQDCYTASRLRPKDDQVLSTCGYILWKAADYAGAVSYFENANYAATPSASSILWLEITRLRAHIPDDAEFARLVAQMKPRGWVQSLCDLYLGKTTPEKTLSDAADASGQQIKGYLRMDPRDQMANIAASSAVGTLCAVEFYVGEWRLLNGPGEPAKSLFTRAATDCRQGSLLFDATHIELQRMGTP